MNLWGFLKVPQVHPAGTPLPQNSRVAATAIHNPRRHLLLGAGTGAGASQLGTVPVPALWSLERHFYRDKETSCGKRVWHLFVTPMVCFLFSFETHSVTSHSFSFPSAPHLHFLIIFSLSYMLSFLVCSFHLVKMHFIPSNKWKDASLNLEQKFRHKPQTQASPLPEDTCTLSSVALCFLNPSLWGWDWGISLGAKPLGESYETLASTLPPSRAGPLLFSPLSVGGIVFKET